MKIANIGSADVQFSNLDDSEQGFANIDYAALQDGGVVKSFIGKAYIYDEEIFIDTITGEGYNVVLRKMKNYIDWYSGKIRLAGFERDDIKQLIVLILLDGIRRYNPKLKIKLSTFLYVHIKNRIISRIKEETRQSLNATYNEPAYKFVCPCNVSFVAYKDDVSNVVCKSCASKIDNTWTIRAEHHEPISLDNLMQSINEDDTDKTSRVYYNGQKNDLIDFFGQIDTLEDFDRDLDVYSVLKEEDEVTRKIAGLMYSQDYSITDAAKEVGLTCWAASLRLKKLSSKRHIKELFLNK
jgi:RNA polymerase sigma factor (sigma-70 family)